MTRRSAGILSAVTLGFALLATGHFAPGAGDAGGPAARVVAGSPRDFMEVRHVVLRGTNEEIGRALATLARERHGVGPAPTDDPLRARAQRRYLARNYPALLERMRGVAAACGKALDDDAVDFGSLGYARMRAGCSVVYYPPGLTADGKGVVSRNYDFSTGTLFGTRPEPGTLPATARPYVVELYPDRGYASIALYSYDLLSGVLDGMNSEGLTVALLADDELAGKFPMEPARDGVGLGVQQVLRYLLDTCADVEQAKEALLAAKQFYEAIPCHYLVADRHGKAFVWEYSQAHNREFIVENPGKALVTTNFSLHRYLEGGAPPSPERARAVCPRYCALAEGVARQPGKVTADFIKQNQRAVDATRPAPPGGSRPPGRTLWHALYFPEEGRMQVSFYLRDEAENGRTKVVRSDYTEFKLARP
jgi:hypothetical protein